MDEKDLYPGFIFKNQYGKNCQIVTIATHSITKEKLVIYQTLYGEYDVRAIPVEYFFDNSRIVRLQHIPDTEKMSSKKLDEENIDNDCCDDYSKKYYDNKKIENISVQEKDECPVGMNPVLYAFLEADTVHDKLKIVRDTDNHDKIDDKCIDDMAACLDVAIDEGSIDARISELVSCLNTMKRFEIIR